MADYHADAGVDAANLLMGRRHRCEDVIRLQRVIRKTIQLSGEDVKQDFRVGSGIDMAPSVFKQLFTQFVGVGQVTVVRQGDAERGVDVKRLRLGGAGDAGGRVADMDHPHIALQALHMPGLENILNQSIGFTQAKAI